MEVHTNAPRDVEIAGALSSFGVISFVEDWSLRSNGARSVSVLDMAFWGPGGLIDTWSREGRGRSNTCTRRWIQSNGSVTVAKDGLM